MKRILSKKQAKSKAISQLESRSRPEAGVHIRTLWVLQNQDKHSTKAVEKLLKSMLPLWLLPNCLKELSAYDKGKHSRKDAQMDDKTFLQTTAKVNVVVRTVVRIFPFCLTQKESADSVKQILHSHVCPTDVLLCVHRNSFQDKLEEAGFRGIVSVVSSKFPDTPCLVLFPKKNQLLTSEVRRQHPFLSD